MTKQHFIALADALRLSKPGGHLESREIYEAKRAQWDASVMRIADVCGESNSRFNRTRWFDYINDKCGPNGGPVKR